MCLSKLSEDSLNNFGKRLLDEVTEAKLNKLRLALIKPQKQSLMFFRQLLQVNNGGK